MIGNRRSSKSILISFFFLTFLSIGNKLSAQNGQALFQQNCASCHAVAKNLTGPALAGVEGRGPWSDRKQLYAWIHNPAKFMASDPYTQGLKQQYGGVVMTGFPQLGEKDIDAIIDYVNQAAAAVPEPGAPVGTSSTTVDESDNSILYGILTLILAGSLLTCPG